MMHVHLVFVTKYCKSVFDFKILNEMEQIFRDICNIYESRLVEFEVENDHVHLLIEYPPKVCIAKLVDSLKGVFSRRLRQLFPQISKNYYKMLCDHLVTLQVLVVVPHLKLLNNILKNNNKDPTKPYISHLEGKSLTA
jgi:putative transposase